MSRPSLLRAAGSAVLLLTLSGVLAPEAAAQVFAGAGSGVAMPAAQPATPPAPVPPAEVIRHMPGTLDGWRITGESGDLSWPLYVSREQAAGARRFRIGYVSAVSILPDVSKLTVRINDQEIGAEIIDAARGLRVVEFAVPSGLLVEGTNAIRLSVRQHHRVDCSVAATYELWTKIDPAQTGLVLAAGARGVAAPSDLPALLLRADGSLPIHIVLPGRTNPPHLQRLLTATSAVALAAHALQPIVDFNAAGVDIYGIDLAVGTRAALARNPRFAAVIGSSGPLTRVLPADAFGRPMLVVTGTDDAELDQAIATIAASPTAEGSDAGRRLARAYPGFATDGAETLVLRDLGVRSEEFSGRFLRKSFNLTLPADFLASDYGRGTFDLAGGYAAGLARGAQVRVDINGKSSGLIKLPDAGGDVFRHNQLFLPLSLMRPGLNRVDVYAETPRPEDASCEASDAKRFLFSDSSRIELPRLARVERLPDLALTAAGGLPFAQGGARLVVPKPDRATMGSALSITARVSVAAGKLVPFVFSTAMPAETGGSTLVVAPARALDPAVMAGIELDPREVEAAWRDTAAAPLPTTRTQGRWWLAGNDESAACRLPSLAKGDRPVATRAPTDVPAPVAVAVHAESEDLLESWSEERRPSRNWLAALRGFADRAQDWASSIPSAVRARFAGPPRHEAISSDSSLLLAQGMSRGSREAVTTIVTAPNSEFLQAAVPCLFDLQVWSKVHGRLTQIDASSGTVTTTDATRFHFVSGSRVSLANARLVVAGWFSLEPMAFVAVAMLLALSLSGTTLWFVRGIGRKSE